VIWVGYLTEIGLIEYAIIGIVTILHITTSIHVILLWSYIPTVYDRIQTLMSPCFGLPCHWEFLLGRCSNVWFRL